jgi:hypothetical protein
MTPEVWRRTWRSRGLGVDRLFPLAYGQPSPTLEELKNLIPKTHVIPGEAKRTLDDADKEVVKDSCVFAMGFIAENLPGQVVCADAKPLLTEAASRLAVRSIEGNQVYVGSVDLLLRLAAKRSGPWQPYDGKELALDFKLTGAASPLGINGPSMRGYTLNMRAVLQAARRERGNRVGRCAVAAFLVYRPPGVTYSGAQHRGAHGFVAYDVDRLLAWDPKSNRLPNPLVLCGKLLVPGSQSEAGADSLPPPPPPARPPARDRWAELGAMIVKPPSWVLLHDFVRVFKLGRGGPIKRISQNVHKRLLGDGRSIQDHQGGVGRPLKIARVADLRRSYSSLS